MRYLAAVLIILLASCDGGTTQSKINPGGGSGSGGGGGSGGGSGGGGGGAVVLSDHLQFQSLTLSGSLDQAGTVTVNTQADEDPDAQDWSVEQTISNSSLNSAFESSVEASDGDGSSERIITLTLSP